MSTDRNASAETTVGEDAVIRELEQLLGSSDERHRHEVLEIARRQGRI